MRKFTAASAFALCMSAIAASAPAHAITIESTATYNGHTYHLLSSDTWTASEAFAQTLGGHLVTVNSLAENSWLNSTFAVPTNINLWIGLNKATNKSQFTWSSGEAFDYNHPYFYKSSTSGEDYIIMMYPSSYNGAWGDYYNYSTWYVPIKGVVEISNSLPVPEPMAMTLLGAGLLGLSTLRRRKVV